jgi:hypothetical protein
VPIYPGIGVGNPYQIGADNSWLPWTNGAVSGLEAGIASMPASLCWNGISTTSEQLQGVFVIPQQTRSITEIGCCVQSTAGSALSYGGFAIYTVASTGALTRVAITNVNLTFASTFSQSNATGTLATPTSYTLNAGQPYAFCVLVVGASTMPNLYGGGGASGNGPLGPCAAFQISGQATLPSTIAAGTVTGGQTGNFVWMCTN